MSKLSRTSNGSDMGYIARCLSGQHSRFFRSSVFNGTWKILSQDLKTRLRRTASGGPVKIAVVGCSAGEEVYSLAIALRHENLLSKVALRGIDNDSRILLRAQMGIYRFSDYDGRIDFFDEMPREYRKHFVCSEEELDLFRIAPRIKESVQFQMADITEECFTQNVSRQDIIIINNVFIHIPKEQHSTVVSNLVERLAAEGRLIVDKHLDHPGLSLAKTIDSIRSYLRIGSEK